MSYYQNLFSQEFIGNWVGSDRQYSVTFKIPANRNTQDYQLAYNDGPWDLTGLDVSGNDSYLYINYFSSFDSTSYNTITIDVSGDDIASTKPYEVVDNLNADSNFSDLFIAEVSKNTVLIKSNPRRSKNVIMWISNDGAERVLRFNKHAGIAELPTYFGRHTIENKSSFSDSLGSLFLLDENDSVHQNIIEEAGFDFEVVQEDWELLNGRISGLFTFQKISVDASDRITQIIEYPAGAKEGALSRKMIYSYSGENTSPSEVFEIPYVLQNNDLINPNS
jgi:hypothetical protein